MSRPAEAPRSYLVDTPTGTVRRNRHHLVTLPSSNDSSKDSSNGSGPRRQKKIHVPSRSPVMTRSHTVSRRKGNVEQHESGD